MPSKALKYIPGSFLEVDSAEGGRKVVMVGRDGCAFWDALDASTSTPISIHPVLRPVEIGTIESLITSRGLRAACEVLLNNLRAGGELELRDDVLLIARVLWALAPHTKGEGWHPPATVLSEAIASAKAQAQKAAATQRRVSDVLARHPELGGA